MISELLLPMIAMGCLVHMVWGHFVLSALNLCFVVVLIGTDPAYVGCSRHVGTLAHS